MNDYKHNLISLVQKTPLLWDPRHRDYKNKDQRKQVWEKIEEMLQPPETGVTAKDTWTSLTRSYNNALHRMKNKSGDGAGSSKPWVFMESMRFLKIVKDKRSTTGNLSTNNDDVEELNESGCSVDDNVSILEQARRLDEKSVARECPRMGFFKSLMPKVQSLTDDQFIEFQLKVLRDLKEVSKPVPQPIYFTQEVMPPNMNNPGTSSDVSTSSGTVYSQESFLELLNNPN
ncbi:uncharacterized protein LOC135473652 [Liolophura sinensis]|uniref:uncharacterized protein LOC135473652 n=1 Tax=Liolophura sinensis TaxID=3198878 RepID=UPI0031584BD7